MTLINMFMTVEYVIVAGPMSKSSPVRQELDEKKNAAENSKHKDQKE